MNWIISALSRRILSLNRHLKHCEFKWLWSNAATANCLFTWMLHTATSVDQRRAQEAIERRCRWLWSIRAQSLSSLARGLKALKGRLEWHSVRAGPIACVSDGVFQPVAVGQRASGVGANGCKSLTSSLQSPSHTLSLVFQRWVPPDPPMYFQWATATLPPSSKLQTLRLLARSLPPLKAA